MKSGQAIFHEGLHLNSVQVDWSREELRLQKMAAACRLRMAGKTYRQIGAALGLSLSGARLLILRARRASPWLVVRMPTRFEQLRPPVRARDRRRHPDGKIIGFRQHIYAWLRAAGYKRCWRCTRVKCLTEYYTRLYLCRECYADLHRKRRAHVLIKTVR